MLQSKSFPIKRGLCICLLFLCEKKRLFVEKKVVHLQTILERGRDIKQNQ